MGWNRGENEKETINVEAKLYFEREGNLNLEHNVELTNTYDVFV